MDQRAVPCRYFLKLHPGRLSPSAPDVLSDESHPTKSTPGAVDPLHRPTGEAPNWSKKHLLESTYLLTSKPLEPDYFRLIAKLKGIDFSRCRETIRSDLYRLVPDVVAILNVTQALTARYYGRACSGTEFLEHQYRRMSSLWETLRERTSASVMQSNFAPVRLDLFRNTI
jgi:hypothetical protein